MTITDILEFESKWPVMDGKKDAAIRERFCVTPARYFQNLNRMLADPSALQADPMLVRRLVNSRDARVRARAVHAFEL